MRVLLTIARLGLPPLLGQSTGASLSGTVVDPLGAAVPVALVTAVNAAAMTNPAGFYSLRPLAIGRYMVKIEKAGFRRERYNDVG